MTANHTTTDAQHAAPGIEGDANARFDAYARASHGASLQRLSPRAQARLAQARQPDSRRDARHRAAWALPMVLAAIAVLAVAMQLRPPPAAVPAPRVSAVTPDTADGASGDPAVALDENPDFYLWLASSDDVMPTTLEH